MKPPIYYACSVCGIVSTLASAFTQFGNGRWCVTCLERKKKELARQREV